MIKTLLAASSAAALAAIVFTPAPSDARQMRPQGSYLSSCSDVSVRGDRLYATCRDSGRNTQASSLDISRCRGADISNSNGLLVCGGQLAREELDKAQADSNYRMKAIVSRHAELLKVTKTGPKYTPVSRRQDRPDAIAWFVRNHPEVTDAQIAKLLGTTKSTIESVRNRTHWNSANIKPVDPVTLGLVGQLALDDLVKKAADKKARDDAKKGGATLQPVEAEPVEEAFVPEARERPTAEPTAESVFGPRS